MLNGTPDSLTTIKVPKQLRERIAARGGEQRMTAAEVIAGSSTRPTGAHVSTPSATAYAHPDASYREETEAWNSLADDGLRP